LTTALWSAAVALCGLAANFTQLLLIRVGVAVGEAGCTPPGFSLIADYFSRSERARAAAIYGLGGPISCVIAYFLAGWLNELYGWRITFLLLGAPGLGLAALAWLTLKDPRVEARTQAETAPVPRVAQPSMREVGVTLWRNVTFRNLVLCLSIMSFFTVGIFQWQPAYMMRTYDLASGATGTWLAVTYGFGGILGSYLGGELASRYAAHNESLQLRALTITVAASGVLSCWVYYAATYQAAFMLMGVYVLAMTTVNGPLFAMIQTLVPERMRAVSFALVYLCSNLIGYGLGPLAAGVLSDAFRPLVGEESLRYALLVLTPGFLWAAWFAWRASKTVAHDLAVAQRALECVVSSAGEHPAAKPERWAPNAAG
jgi:MFS transporter, Spinster family, sphingosine-1-phosphate transporter